MVNLSAARKAAKIHTDMVFVESASASLTKSDVPKAGDGNNSASIGRHVMNFTFRQFLQNVFASSHAMRSDGCATPTDFASATALSHTRLASRSAFSEYNR